MTKFWTVCGITYRSQNGITAQMPKKRKWREMSEDQKKLRRENLKRSYRKKRMRELADDSNRLMDT